MANASLSYLPTNFVSDAFDLYPIFYQHWALLNNSENDENYNNIVVVG
jgi:hypothetical protein